MKLKYYAHQFPVWLHRLVIIVVAMLIPFVVVRSAAADPSKADLDAIYGDSTFYDPTSEGATAGCTPVGSTGGSGGQPGPVYLVGDSIGTQIIGGLSSAFNGNFKGNALASRTISTSSPSPNGLGAIDVDADYIKTAGSVVVELGTNSGGFSAETVTQMITKIRNLAPNASIYWVDTAVVQRTDIVPSLNNVNKIIYGQAGSQKYTVISWNKRVFGETADPTNINPAANDNGLINKSDGINVHLTASGVAAMVDLISNYVKKGPATGANGCACTLLAGNTNPEKIWNFLITKGLTPPQAAGIMGNLQAESGFRPEAEQAPGSWNDMSSVYRRAVGIAQWDGGRRPALINAAKAQGKDPKDLGFQLEYLFQEATKRGDWDRVKQTTSAGDAAFVWHKYFEVSADSPAKIQGRMNNANALLAQYGSGTGPSTAAPGGALAC